MISWRNSRKSSKEDPDYQEGGVNNIFMTQSENVCVIDSGCPKSVMSQMWANTYKASLMNTEKFQDYHFKERKEYELFKFGLSLVYTSTRSMIIPIVLGDEVKEVEVSIVHTTVPFLLGRDYLNKWNCELMFKENSLIINKVKKVKLETNRQGHITLKLLDAETEIIKTRNTFLLDCEDNKMKEKWRKILENITEEEDDQRGGVETEAEREEVVKNITEGRNNSEDEKEDKAKGKEDNREDEEDIKNTTEGRNSPEDERKDEAKEKEDDQEDEVEDDGQRRTNSRWVVNQKEEHENIKSKTKSRQVVRGFQED